MASCTILILTYKGKHHLELLLPTVREAIAHYRGKAEIDTLIVDNGCDEPTRQFVHSNYPEIKYLFSPLNDYLFSLNPFIRDLPSDFVLILNDDMKMEQNILNEIIPLMEGDDSLFSVTCRIMDFDGHVTVSGVRQARYSRGWMYHFYLGSEENQTKYTLYPGGGAAIFRTKQYNHLNGFDELYRPAYSEDTDLGIRAWQQGWKVIYHPPAVLFHREGGTIKDQFKKNKLEQMINRNHIFWMVKNVRYPGFLFWFMAMLPYRIMKAKKNNTNLYNAFRESLHFLPSLITKRRSGTKSVLADKIWLQRLNQEYVK